uniref:NPH3 domain-containing protein n=1 Tax=Salix viminalis TaxID=40686 RepID=A0A6N2L072_SALVM
MKKASFPESILFSESMTSHLAAECWFDDACILDMDYFVKTLAGIKAKGVRPDLIGSIIAHYASKWLPDLSGDHHPGTDRGLTIFAESPESVTTLWMKKRFFVETLVGILPPEKDSVQCNFLLRLLRIANMVGLEPTYRAELEKRISWQLDQASLEELMIPSFSHTCGTLLDVELIIRLVGMFVNLDEVAKSGAALIKVAKLVDSYLAEASVDSNLNLSEFVALAGALPSHARATDDGLYRAIDTYLKAHPGVTKQERKVLFRLLDSRKLSHEASLHVAQNERWSVRAVVQVLFFEQTKHNRQMDWSGSFSGTRSPYLGFEASTRCLSKREMCGQQTEVRKLREDVHRLQSQCYAMQMQMERLSEKKKGFFRWKFENVMPSSRLKSNNLSVVDKIEKSNEGEVEVGCGIQTPVDLKTKLVRGKKKNPRWRKSIS